MAEGLSTPSGMGGLMRFNEEYPSRLQISPEQVIILTAVVIVAMILIKIFL
ncbi:MAG: preprotein translocase subunit Sec61beta [archaeon]|nr:preprotein translocase subunit Sec61beta [archaeon]